MGVKYLYGIDVTGQSTFSTNVGIGTLSPGYRLSVIGASSTDAFGLFSGGSGGTKGGIYLGNDGFQYGSLWFDNATNDVVLRQNYSNGNLIFGTNSTEKVRITSAGNLLIGTTADSGYKLDVAGTGRFTNSGSSNTLTLSHSSGSGIALNISKGGNGEGLYVNKTSGTGNAVTVIGTLNATTLVKNGGTSTQYLMADGSVSTLTNPVTGTGTTNYLPKWTSGSAIGNSQIFDNGNVGIGTASPGTKLQISDAASPIITLERIDATVTDNELIGRINFKSTDTNDTNPNAYISAIREVSAVSQVPMALTFGTGVLGTVNERLRITSGGDVLVSTTAAQSSATNRGNITIGGTSSSILSFGWGTSNRGYLFHDGNLYLINQMSNNLIFGTAGLEAMRITSAGNVGIGTTAPGAKLQVSNTVDGYVSIIENLGTGGDKSGLWVKTDSSWTSAIILKLTSGTSDTSIMEVNPATVRIGGGTLTANDARLHVVGDINITNANLSNQENLDVDTGTEVISIAPIALYTAAFFDFVVKNGANVRSGTVYACHDGTSVEYTETSTADLGNTSAVVFTVDISAGNMRLLATTTTDNWSIKTLTRTI